MKHESVAHLYSRLATRRGRQMVYRRNGDCVVLWRHNSSDAHSANKVSSARTNTPILHGLSNTLPHTTSRTTLPPPAFCAISRRFRLRSKPIVHTLPGLSRGSGRYFPLPVPESIPTHPEGKEDKNVAMIGQGYRRYYERMQRS